VAVFVLALYAVGSAFLRQRDPLHLLLLAGTAACLASPCSAPSSA
jgi:hypothetical protein